MENAPFVQVSIRKRKKMTSQFLSKKSTIIVCLLFLVFNLSLLAVDFENSVQPATALRVAESKLASLEQATGFNVAETRIVDSSNAPLFYLCDLEPQGYMVVTANRALPPVLAYSLTDNAQRDTEAEAAFIGLVSHDIQCRTNALSSLPAQMIAERETAWEQLIAGVPTDKRFTQWPPAGTTPTGGWLSTKWSQGAPYKNFCPLDLVNGGRSIAGCPAVALAQIMNYHKTINDVFFDDNDDYYHNYGGNKFWFDDDYVTYDFPSFPDLNTHLATLQSHYDSGTTLTADDKAAINIACGIAAKQVYSASISGTYGVHQARNAYQKFNCDTIELLYDGAPDLYARMSQNMKHAQPVHFAVVNPAGTAGHNVVVDGYNTDDYYHVNFGWGGSYNGWYLLPDEMPYSLTVVEGVVLDILVYNAELAADTLEIPCPAGGTVNFTLDAGDDNAARRYIVLGSATGTTPGMTLPGDHKNLPINWDVFTDLCFEFVNTPFFLNFLGYLDANGQATAQLNTGVLPSGLGGTLLHFAFTCNNVFDIASNPVTIEIIE